MASYWYVREHVGRGLFHLVEGNAGSQWREESTVQAICGNRIVSEDGQWAAQYEGDASGWVMCASCTQRARRAVAEIVTRKNAGIFPRNALRVGHGTLWERFRNALSGRWAHGLSVRVLILACREV